MRTAVDMQALVASTQRRVLSAWLLMVRHLREANPVAQIAERGRLLGLDAAAGEFAAGELAAYIAAGQATARAAGEIVVVRKKLLIFDAADTGAASWAASNKLDKIREITGDQRDLVRDLLTAGARAGVNPRVTAGAIYGSIGLTDYQAGIVENYRRQLEQGGAAALASLDRALTHGVADRTVIAAVRDGRMIPPERIDAMVDQYRDAWLRFRAEQIARTEGLRVAHQASDELYRQAVARGDLQAAQLQQKWVHTNKRKYAREFHETMNGQLRQFGEPFVSGRGRGLRFPGDPLAPPDETLCCTCVKTTRILPRTA
jgi:hypothetical protein